LTAAQKDQFILEQRISARLVGLDPETIPGSMAELETYLATMIPRLAYTAESGRIRAIMVPRKRPRYVSKVFTHLMKLLATVDLLTDDMRQLYGSWWCPGPFQRGLLATASNGFIRAAVKKTPYERLLPRLREQARVHAFGSKALKINKDLRQTTELAQKTQDSSTAD
jgi:uncharacterized protein (DUF2236 family)